MQRPSHLQLVDSHDGGKSLVLVLDDGTTLDLSDLTFRDPEFVVVGDVAEFQELGLRVTFAVDAAAFLISDRERTGDLDLAGLAASLADLVRGQAMADEVKAAGATVDES